MVWLAFKNKIILIYVRIQFMYLARQGSDVDPHWLYAEPYPQNLMNADPGR